MKNLTKIFLAIVAGMLAFSCVTDTIVDPTIELGDEVNGAGQYTLTLSLGENDNVLRTELGEKVGTNYPVKWCEDDAVAVNGTPSTSIEITNDEGTAAKFTFGASISRPYHVVYPVAEGVEAVAEGCYPVTFLSTQHYTEGTFCEGAAPMCGYASEDEASAVKMQHLTSVLRFLVKGSNTLTSMTITAEKGVISGNYDVNCQTGEVTPHDDARNDITLSFGEGLVLGEEAIPVYVTVPAGEGDYGMLVVKLRSAEGVMSAKINTSAKPLTAGVVREFNDPIVFVPGQESEDPTVFEIANDVDMATLKNMIANNSFHPYTSARVVADVTMPADWTPIEGFAYTFDGGNNAIKDLKAPLFGTVNNATIKNVKLTNVAIAETERLISGALVCKATNSVISNCSTAGTLTYTYAGEVAANAATNEVQAIGGLVGLAKDTNITGCTNDIDMTGKQFWKNTGTGKRYPAFGGVVGHITATNNPASREVAYKLQNCTNLGSVTNEHNATTYGGELGIQMGGVAGRANNVYVKTITNGKTETENGAVTIKAYANSPYWGGCIGWLFNSFADGLTNYAPVSFTCKVQWSCMGGVVGTLGSSAADWSIAENLYNYGSVSSTSTASAAGLVTLGGVIGRSQSTKWTIKNAYNYGGITVEGDFSSVGSEALVGGVFAECNVKEAFKCYNYGDIKVKANSVNSALYAGGVAGTVPSKTTNTTISYCESGSATVRPVVEVTTDNTKAGNYVGGCFGYINTSAATNLANVSHCKNYSNVKLEATTATQSWASGIVSYMKNGSIDYCENDGAVYVDMQYAEDNTIGGNFGGIAGSYSGCQSFTNNKNLANGDITIKGNFGANLAIMALATGTPDTSNCSNAGDIDVYATNNGGSIYICGITWSTGKTHTNFTNSGNFTFYGSIDNAEKYLFMSGCDYNAAKKLDKCTNSGTLKVDASATFPKCTGIQIGGISRTVKEAVEYASCSNSGNIIFAATASCEVHLGGLAAGTENNGTHTISGDNGFVNSGAISFTGSTSSVLRMGGVIGKIANNRTFTNISNNGALSFNCSAATTAHIGGVAGSVEGGINTTLDGCNNHGSISVAGTATGKSLYVGGVLGYALNTAADKKATVTNCQNTSEAQDFAITVSATCKNLSIGGIVGHTATNVTKTTNGTTSTDTTKSIDVITNCTNNCPINFTGTVADGDIYFGGVLGSGYLGSFTGNENGLKGDITTSGTVNKNLGIGGLAGRMMNIGATNCTNKGDIVCNSTNTAATVYLCGAFYGISGGKTWDNIVNEGNITFGGRVEASSKYIFMSGITYNPSGTFKNMSNSGNLRVTKEAFIKGMVNMGGIFRCLDSTLTVENCSNSGDLIFEGSTDSYVQMGGLASYTSGADTTLTLKGFTNSGDLRVAAVKCTSAEMGGVLGKVTNKAVVLQNTISNSGNIYNYVENADKTKTYVNTSGTIRAGGIFGWDAIGGHTGAMENSGNITFENKVEGKTCYIGGICGQEAGAISGATTTGTITAIGFTNVGAIMGVSRTDAIKATNCVIGGSIDKGYYGDYTDDFGIDQTGWTTDLVPISASNFFNYIYATAVTPEVAAADNCTCPTQAQ